MFKEVRALSGGERSRLELALLGILPSNLLLLDEPTNHLDIAAREAIEAFLRETPATLLVVSHDRRLLETICERLWVVDDGLAVPVRRRLPGLAGGGRRGLDRRGGGRAPRRTGGRPGAGRAGAAPAQARRGRRRATAAPPPRPQPAAGRGTAARAEAAHRSCPRTPTVAGARRSTPT